MPAYVAGRERGMARFWKSTAMGWALRQQLRWLRLFWLRA
jgi:hypothetical protein